MNAIRLCCAFVLVCLATLARASYHTFVMDEIYSNADGTVQYIVLRESQDANGENLLAGHALTSSHAGIVRTFTFPHDLASSATAGKRALIATPAFAALNLATPDYIVAPQFIATDGGTLDYAGVDRWTHPPVPTDGVNALLRSGATAVNVATNFAGQTASAPARPISVVEYYNPSLDHYFVSALAPDIDALDSGRIAGWTRTGHAFNAFASGTGVSPVCRFYIPPEHGNSHFFSASPDECSAVLQKIATDPNYSGYIYESPDVYDTALPDPATGVCPAGTMPVYRLWNGRADSNHRYTNDSVIKANMLGLGYIAEGYGADATSMCATTGSAATSEFRASGASPFTLGCDLAATSGTLYTGSEVEPSVAIDPRDANHLIGAWQQDRWSSGGARGILTAVSFDGGATWSRQSAPLSRCTGGNTANGGDYARVSDPWVTIAPDGAAYQVALAFIGNTFARGSSSAVLVSHSGDGGRTWGNPATIIRDDNLHFNDKESITADATDARYVYVTWDRLAADGGGPSYLARTTDNGATWEAARAIYDPGDGSQTINNQIVVLPDGTLVDFFTELDAGIGEVSATLRVIRSLDKGSTWSAPSTISVAQSVGTHDPDTSFPVRDGENIGAIAVGRQGQLVVAWQDSRFSGGVRDGIALSQSFDGGRTWSLPVQVNRDPTVAAFVPSVALLADGTIGVAYYDFRSNTTSQGALQTDYWLALSADASTWRENHLAGPFNLATAPLSAVDDADTGSGYFLGDYQALATNGTTFIPFYARTNNGDLANRTDIFATIGGSPLARTALARASAEDKSVGIAREKVAPLASTPELDRSISDSIIRAMQRRVPGWKMPSSPAPSATPPAP